MKYLICGLLIVIGSKLQAQTTNKIRFDYDAAGNRTFRGPCSACIQQQPQDTLPLALALDSTLFIDVEEQKSPEGENVLSAESEMLLKEKMEEIAIFPNPTLADVYIRLPQELELFSFSLNVRDVSGRIIHSQQDVSNQYSFSLASHPAGSYFIELEINGRKGKYTLLKQ